MKEVQRAGGRLSEGCFDPNGEYLFVACGNQVRQHEVDTGNLVKTFAVNGEVRCISWDPCHPGQLLIGCYSGLVCAMEVETGKMTWHQNYAVPVLKVLPQADGSLLLWTQRPAALTQDVKKAVDSRQEWLKRQGASTEQIEQVLQDALAKKTVGRLLRVQREGKSQSLVMSKVMGKAGVAQGSSLALADGCMVQLSTGETVEIGAQVTCLDWLNDRALLVGDDRGHITIHGEKRQVLHWHAHSVEAIAACPDGQHFLSGGAEGVLVHWDARSGEKRFLPRLPAPIRWIRVSGSGATAALALDDNSIQLVSVGTLELLSCIQGIPAKPVIFSAFDGNRVAISGVPGALLLFDPVRDQLTGELDLGRQNLLGGTPDKPLAYFELQAMAKGGNWMACYEARCEEGAEFCRLEGRLTFWEKHGDGYRLVYSVDDAHLPQGIRAMAFRPASEEMITVGGDGTWCKWQLITIPTATKRVWALCQQGSYLRQVPCQAVAYSLDGSVVAIAQDKAIVLLRAEDLSEIEVVNCGLAPKQLLFVGAEHLLAVGEEHMILIDLIDLTPVWTTRAPEAIVSSLEQGEWLVSLPDEEQVHLLRFSVNNVEPLSKLTVKATKPSALCQLSGELVCLLTRTGHLLTIALNDDYTLQANVNSTKKESALARLLESAPMVPPKVKRARLQQKLNIPTLVMQTTPSHLLPSLIDLFNHYIRQRLQ